MSFQKIHCIALNGLEVFANHGYYPEEQLIGGKFKVDVKVETDFSSAAITDDLGATLNYESLFEIVSEEMKTPSKLLEHVGQRIVDRIALISVKIQRIEVKIEKLNPPFAAKIQSSSIGITYLKPNHAI
ncbi:dihydroneopterin aldolase [Solitalea sp. MAHUQ-68]|uniref:7,8-dihydroneopterin aldolase n=1 Tax=Solitalea agri TaxID=2953739 RepID=A0A9X2F6E1_9SPHI|nr:dihydroneopterin aldolase [Solitalea agri]MCO4291583.1 dihydroneopterin aldolase [Solitalea agri]